MADPFQVHDIAVRQQPFFRANGQTGSQHVVTFFVGPHGPFVLTVDDPNFKGTAVKEQIEAKVRELRELHQNFGGETGRAG